LAVPKANFVLFEFINFQRSSPNILFYYLKKRISFTFYFIPPPFLGLKEP
jgi:hypothetical protein